ncbi:MAG TPA: dihydrolipoyl dehydrogenase [Chloroflexota bacterium]|jgi:dihydrolipoamide dehydrogenase|nr:dihydrolipoyl dehydrogenase [Chloroflexota bacterium]
MADQFDVVVIGGGPGGYVTAIKLAIRGRSVALVEKEKLGGACLHRGCIPTKIYLESAGLYQKVRHASDLGVKASGVKLDFGAIASRRDKIVSANAGGIAAHFRAHGVTAIPGTGRLVGNLEVVVDGPDGERRLKARDVILATGSTPRLLPGLEADGERIVTSDHVTQWTVLPRSIVIVGAGAVGAEFASAMNDFGVETTLLEFLPRVLPREDLELSEVVHRSFTRRGIAVLASTKVIEETVKADKGGVKLEVETNGQRKKLAADCLLVATSRDPYVQGLGLEKTRVKVERGVVKVDAGAQTDEPHVYAIGDLVGGLMLAHAAHAEGEAAMAAILGQRPVPVDYNAIPRATYTRPEVASIGLTEEEARAGGRDVKVGKFGFRANPRAMIQAEGEGLVKFVADGKTGEILGVHLSGPQATELIHELVLAKLLEATTEEIELTVHAHPTLSEAIWEAAADVLGRSPHSPPKKRPSS